MSDKRDEICAAYCAAYKAANEGRYVSCEYFGGWFTVYTGGLTQSKYRARQIVDMTATLRECAK